MKKIFVFLIFIFANIASNLFGQGLNNSYPVDSTDVKNVFNMLGIEVYKFPIQKQKEKNRLRIIEKKYVKHKLVSSSVETNSEYDKDRFYLNEKEKTLRVYKQNVNDSTIMLRIDFDYTTITNGYQFEKDSIGIQMTRAYTDFQPVKGKTVPIFIWYAFTPEKNEMHCPGDAPIETVVELYDYVVAILLEVE